MSAPVVPAPPSTSGSEVSRADRVRAGVADLAVSVLVMVALALVAAVLWKALVHLPTFQRTAQGAEMDQVQLAKLVGIEGWYVVLGGVAGLLGAAALTLLRAREPVWIVVCIVLASVIGAVVMWQVGLHLGPQSPTAALRSAHVGGTAPVQLHPRSKAVAIAWPLGATIGAVIVLLLVGPRKDAESDAA